MEKKISTFNLKFKSFFFVVPNEFRFPNIHNLYKRNIDYCDFYHSHYDLIYLKFWFEFAYFVSSNVWNFIQLKNLFFIIPEKVARGRLGRLCDRVISQWSVPDGFQQFPWKLRSWGTGVAVCVGPGCQAPF